MMTLEYVHLNEPELKQHTIKSIHLLTNQSRELHSAVVYAYS